MFGRASRQLAICVHYQTRLIERHQIRQQPASVHICPQHVRRQSSTVTAPVEDDEHGDTPAPSASSVGNASHNPPPIKQSTNSAVFRRLRPQQVEKLEIDALGKPAEVLILPTRDRKASSSAAINEEDGKRINLQQSLDLDLQPVSLSDALGNIESLRVEMGEDKHEFTTAEWNDHRRRLADGFTKAQLQEYLRVNSNQGSSLTHISNPSGASQKRNVADLIMVKSWGWRCTDVAEHAEKTVAAPLNTRKIAIGASRLGFILHDRTQPLRHISETFDVQVDVFKKNKQLVLNGSATAVMLADARLRESLSTVREGTLKITDSIARLLNKEPESSLLITKLAQKHNLYIIKETELLRIVGRSADRVGVVHRDLLMLSRDFLETTPFTMWQELEKELSQAPFYLEDLPEWLCEGKSWYRHASSYASNDTEESGERSGNRKARRMAENALKLDKYDQELLSRFVVAPGCLKHEYHVNIGQVLFGRPNNASPNQAASSKSSHHEPSLLASYHTLLPQILAKKDFIPLQVSQPVEGASKETTARPLLLRLRLRPLSQGAYCPQFEVLLSGNDVDLGLRQQLEIRSVVAIIDEWRHNLLLPHLPVDIEMVRRSELNLLGDVDSKPTKGYLKVLRQIGSFLKQAQSSDPPEIPAIWKLDVRTLFREPPVESKVEDGGDLVPRKNQSGGVGGKSKALGASVLERASVTYVADPPEFLDVATYTSTLTEEGYLEHITCDTDAVERPLSRQTLRITQTPLYNLLHGANPPETTGGKNRVQRQKRVKHSVGAAYDVACLIRDAASSAGRSAVSE